MSEERTEELTLASMLPEGYVCLGYAVSIKALNAEGDVVIIDSRSEDLTAWEAIGMVTTLLDDLRDSMRSVGGDD